MAKIIKTNMSGHELTFEYATDTEAEALFEFHCKTATQAELHRDADTQWFVVWNRKLDKCFDCWK